MQTKGIHSRYIDEQSSQSEARESVCVCVDGSLLTQMSATRHNNIQIPQNISSPTISIPCTISPSFTTGISIQLIIAPSSGSDITLEKSMKQVFWPHVLFSQMN